MMCDLCRENKTGLIWLHNGGERLAVCPDCEKDLMVNTPPEQPLAVGKSGYS
jgi:hypothetical protein